jgi:hypothetical protein
VLALLLTSRFDFSVNTASPGFMIQQSAAILMALCAVAAAFASIVPGYSRAVVLLPAVGVATWLTTLLSRVPQEWRSMGLSALADTHEPLCVATISLAAAPLVIGLTPMLRKGAPLTPRLTMALGLLGAASLSNVLTCIASPHQSAIAVLVWHGTTLAVLCMLAATVGRAVLPSRRPVSYPTNDFS